ncbi:hypothetical protein [Kordia sp.]|uniref:hypothetical protein n=1 Tax=Kordia sp. TaxID=1965332 RepID=UPI003D6C1D56
MNHTNENSYESSQFIALLKHKKVEKAICTYMKHELTIEYNQKERIVHKNSWLKYLKGNLLKPSIKLVQFEISEIESLHNNLSFTIHLICKNLKGNLFFTEVTMHNKWSNKKIHKTTYKITSH